MSVAAPKPFSTKKKEDTTTKDDTLSDKEVDKSLEEFGEYDPKLVLATYQLPGIDLLSDHGGGNISVDEVAENCNTISYEILTKITNRVYKTYVS